MSDNVRDKYLLLIFYLIAFEKLSSKTEAAVSVCSLIASSVMTVITGGGHGSANLRLPSWS